MRRAILTALAACIVAACSLGLDESLIGRTDAGSPDVSTPDDASAPDGAEASTDASSGLATTCTTDADCTGSDPCVVGTCDLTRKTCAYDVCRPPAQACQVAACDQGTRTCGAPKPYTFKAAQFPVGAGLGCGGAPGRCFAVVYPFVFVGTSNGVLAFSAADPSATAPASVPVTGLAFSPTQMLASGNRVWFLGAPFGTGASSRVPIAWVDVPVDPFAKAVHARSVLATFDRPAADPVGLALAPNGNAFLIDTNAASAYATAKLDPPLAEPLALSGFPSPMTANAAPVAPSGTRFLTQILAQQVPQSQTGTPTFGFVTGVGAPGAQNAGEAPLTAVAPVSPQIQTFAASSTGAVLWVTESLIAAPVPAPVFIRALKAYFLVADGNANVDSASGVDLLTYPAMSPWYNGQPLIGPAALVDATTAMVTGVPSTVPPPFQQTDVMFVKKAPLGVVKNADASTRKITIALPVGSLAAGASHGRGYVLAAESAAAASVYVLDPSCAP